MTLLLGVIRVLILVGLGLARELMSTMTTSVDMQCGGSCRRGRRWTYLSKLVLYLLEI